jgi:selenocysteine-specific elongation factor
MRSIVIGTAGHIDHGKSALVQAITGTDPDRLKEEKTRGITIDLGFAHREVIAPDGSALQLSFIDVPGHAGFIHNMLAGAAGIDLALLVISAEEGIMPQTREHFAICRLLGVRRGLAVLTRADAVPPGQITKVRSEVARFLEGSFFENGPAGPLAVSARTGEGIPELLNELTGIAAQIPSRDADGLIRLPIDRSFSVRGFGAVVTGTLVSGTIHLEDKLRLEPGGRSVRVRGIQTHGNQCPRAVAGSRVALNLAGVDHLSIARGDTVVAPETLTAVSEIDAEITMLPDTPPLKHGAQVTFHAFTSECPAAILFYGRPKLESGAIAPARLRLRRPVVLAPGDRFILRLPSPAETIGGGMVLDAHPLAKQSRRDALRWLESLSHAGSDPESILVRRVARRHQDGLEQSAAVREMAMTPARIETIVSRCLAAKKLARIGEIHLVERAVYDAAMQRMLAEIAAYHAAQPAHEGIRRVALQTRCGLSGMLFTAVLDELAQKKILRVAGDLIAAQGFAAKQNAGDRRLLDLVIAHYAKAGLETPPLREVAAALGITEAEGQRLLAVLVKENALVRIASDAYVHAEKLRELREKLAALRGRSIGVVEFKQLTGLSRKHAIPWLEYLDRAHITRRTGDMRQVI